MGIATTGCPEHFIEVVTNLYNGGVITWVSNDKAITGDIDIQSRVQQGYSLSPLLYNMVMDELVEDTDC